MEDALVTRLSELGGGTEERPVRLGRYDVVGRLGRGGMGSVYEARDRQRETRVALKTLLVADAAAGLRLKREFRAVADLAHDNLAPVYELGCEDGLWFFTMERVLGRTLASWARGEHVPDRAQSIALPLSRTLSSPGLPSTMAATDFLEAVDTLEDASLPQRLNGAIDVGPPLKSADEIMGAMAQLADGVAALHEAGLRHGDVKPDNVLVRDDGRVILVDFGLARRVDDVAAKVAAGTPSYMPPEQIAGEYVGPESDWYAVGATVYRVLTGRLPFEASSMLEMFFKKAYDVPRSPHELVPTVPRELSALCVALLHPDPAQRPGHAEVLRVCAGEAMPSLSSERRRPRFVGRETELCVLERAYGTARAGYLALVRLHGPSGIGKSALLRSFLDAVGDMDAAVVLHGRCYERESVPYKGFDRIVDEIAERLAAMDADDVRSVLPEDTPQLVRAFPVLTTVPAIADRASGLDVAHDAREVRHRARAALCELLGAFRRRQPVVLAIDDLQWADADTVSVLEALSTGVGGQDPPGLLIVASYRPVEADTNPRLKRYLDTGIEGRVGVGIDLAVEPLRPEESEILARAALEALGVEATDDAVQRLSTEARGQPFFIEELAHHVAEQGAAAIHGEVSLEDAIAARLDGLDEDQRALIEILAVAASPLPQSLAFEAAQLDAGALSALLALRRASLVSWLGAGADDTVSTYHDRIREVAVSRLDVLAQRRRHLELGRALARRSREEASSPWVFDATRHLRMAEALLDDPAERLDAARLHLRAGRRAREAAAFGLASTCFEGGLDLLTEDAWRSHYELRLGLSVGAVEAAYLSAEWTAFDRRLEEVKVHGRTVTDQLPAWEAQIDAAVGRHRYVDGVDAAIHALGMLDVHLSSDPTDEEVGAAVAATLPKLLEMGPERLTELPDLDDPRLMAATRLQVRVSPAAYFCRPKLLPIIACRLIDTSLDHGLSEATPYALALFGIVLNTMKMYDESHRWGQLASSLIERWPDRRMETATRHILLDLVCCWTVPLSTVLEPLRAVFDLGCRAGDYEYASYAAHGYVHNAMYAGRPLAPLVREAQDLSEKMRGLGMVNALHVHTPFVRLLLALTGERERPWSLDGDGFDEQRELAEAEEEGSRSGIFVLSVVMGLSRFHFGRYGDGLACFERAYAHIDAAPSVWHVPIMHQFGALSAELLRREAEDVSERARLRAISMRGRAALEELVEVQPINFAHRVALVQGAAQVSDGDPEAALEHYERAIARARDGGWVNDVALANELMASAALSAEDRGRYLRAARAAYAAWGAEAKVRALADRLGA